MTLLQTEPGIGFASYLPLLLVFVAMYFFLIRPQQNQQKRRREMLSRLEKGNQVVTVGGIHGEIVSLDDDIVVLRIADNTDITIARSGVGRVKGNQEGGSEG